jgi:hypothetical protein
MKKLFIFLAVLLTPILSHCLSFKEKLTHGQPGDFIVIQQGKSNHLLLLRALSESTLILEQISVPENVCPENWKAWVADRAPGHTSWVAIQIDLRTNRLVDSYSYVGRITLTADDQDNFLTRLLLLSLDPIPDRDRKRIGPPPPEGEEDRRKIWKPKIVMEGQAVEQQIRPWAGRWPKDDTRMSGCKIVFYFSNFSFPYWIEIQASYGSVFLRAIDSGTGLESPMPLRNQVSYEQSSTLFSDEEDQP